MNTIIKLFRRYFLAQFIIDLINKQRDIGIKQYQVYIDSVTFESTNKSIDEYRVETMKKKKQLTM